MQIDMTAQVENPLRIQASYGRGRDHLAGGYCGRGVYHWSGYGGCVWRL